MELLEGGPGSGAEVLQGEAGGGLGLVRRSYVRGCTDHVFIWPLTCVITGIIAHGEGDRNGRLLPDSADCPRLSKGHFAALRASAFLHILQPV